MNPAVELRDIVIKAKSIILANREMGLEPIVRKPLNPAEIHIPESVEYSLEELRKEIGDCTRCKLSINRTRLVFGEGSPRAKLVFVGEGPGHEEDLAGRPFVGEAGKILTRIIEMGMKLKREDVYICNIVKCRPPHNRDPERDEIDSCIQFLKRQLQIIRPEVICCLGRIAGKELIGKDFQITRERGQWRSYMDIPVMPTFHPAYILRNPARERELKGLVWKDIKNIMVRLGMEV